VYCEINANHGMIGLKARC